ncbi:MAG: methyltransferase domain-containing protein, partial [bacterium]|nr:methyltransferase domain-containing protein [bacterium]
MTMVAPHIRYQFKPFVGSNHWWALRQFRNLSSSTRVLDVGSGSGAIGQALKTQGVTNLCAVEVDAEAREHAKSIYTEVASDISEFSGRTFDLVILLDVLEHVTGPQGLYEDAMKLLAPGGKVLI